MNFKQNWGWYLLIAIVVVAVILNWDKLFPSSNVQVNTADFGRCKKHTSETTSANGQTVKNEWCTVNGILVECNLCSAVA